MRKSQLRGLFLLSFFLISGFAPMDFPDIPALVSNPDTLLDSGDSTYVSRSLATQVENNEASTSIASTGIYDNSRKPEFIVRTEGGQVFHFNASELNNYVETSSSQIWGLGIRTKFGVVAYYTNDNDPNLAHGQIITYPVFSNGTLPALNKPILASYLRMWTRAGDTWYRNYLTSRPLFVANSFDPRTSMNAMDKTNYLEIGWSGVLTIQGFDFDIYIGLRMNKNNENQIDIKTNITSLSRSWDGFGLEYVLSQSSFYDGTDYQILYASLESDTDERIFRLNQFKDMKVDLPGHYNKTTLYMRNNVSIHSFDWDNLRDSGFTDGIAQIEQLVLPNGESDYVLRTGMFGIRNIPQNYKIVIDPSLEITSDSAQIYTYGMARDSDNIPYILADVNDILYLFKGNAANATSFTNVTFPNHSSNDNDASLKIADYSGTEYIFVNHCNSTNYLIMYRSTVAGFSFTGYDVDTSAVYGNPSFDIGTDGILVVARGYNGGNNRQIGSWKSTDGGVTWADELLMWDETGGTYTRSPVVVYDGSYYHIGVGMGSPTMHTKRWSNAGGLEWYNGTGWQSDTTGDDGYNVGYTYWHDHCRSFAMATANILVFMFHYESSGEFDRGRIAYSTDGGVTWAEKAQMGDRNYAGRHTAMILTNATHTDYLYALASNDDSGLNDINTALYNITADSFSNYALYWDSGNTSDVVQNYVMPPKQINEGIDFSYVLYNVTDTTYYLYYECLVEATSGGDSTAPTFTYDGTSTSNNTDIQFNVTNALANWSVTETGGPSHYWIFTNATGSNTTLVNAQTYSNGDYLNGSYTNTNITNINLVIWIQVVANDTAGNYGQSTAFYTVIEDTPTWSYDGTSTSNNTDVEFGGTILSNWSLGDANPKNFTIYSNSTGVNQSKSSGSWSDGDYKSWSFLTTVDMVGNVYFIQIFIFDFGNYYNSSIAYFTITDDTPPVFNFNGTTNGSSVEIGTPIIYNTSISEALPDTAIISSNSTGSLLTKVTEEYSNGGYVDWTYSNLNCSNVNQVIMAQIVANDSSDNQATEKIYVTVINTAPSVSFSGTANNSIIEWESGGAISISWTVTESYPDIYVLYWNQTGSNTTRATGSYSGSVTNIYDPGLSDVDNVIWFQLVANDSCGAVNVFSRVYYTITNTDNPTVTVESPTNSTTTGNTTITLSSTNADLDQYWYEIYYSNGTQHTANTTWSSSVELNISIGSYYIIGYCNDTAGLEDSETVYFSISAIPTTTAVIGGKRLVDRLMSPGIRIGSQAFPLIALMLISGVGIGSQLSVDDPPNAIYRGIKWGIIGIFSLVLLLCFGILFALDHYLVIWIESIQVLVTTLILSLAPLWEFLVQPAFPGNSNFPLFGLIIFVSPGITAHYVAPNPNTIRKRQIKRGLMILSALVLLYMLIIILKIPQYLNDGMENIEILYSTLDETITPIMKRLNDPVFPFLEFTMPIYSLILLCIFNLGTLYITKIPRSSFRSQIKRLMTYLFIIGLIYALCVLFIPNEVIGVINYVGKYI